MHIVAWVVVGLFSLTGLSKLINLPSSLAERDRLKQSPRKWYVIGALEILGAAGIAGVLAGYLPAAVGLAAAWGLCMLMLGAMGTRMTFSSRENAHDWLLILDVVVFALAVTTLVYMFRL
jgi:uncharacterized membrane protein HdeD (DUF308 family)